VEARFSTLFQTGPLAHPAYNGYWIIPEDEATGSGVNHPPPPSIKVKE